MGRPPLSRTCSLVAMLIAAGCQGESAPRSDSVLRLATTTSTDDSGLMEHLLPAFEAAHDARVDVIAVGTGQALKLGERGDVDALLVHDRDRELSFVQAGHAIRREDVMHNRFVLLGPAADPARVRGSTASEALGRIRTAGAAFLSRGDHSGTHLRERSLWEAAGGLVPWDGYLESGRGQGPSLIIADQTQSYVLTDRGTYLAFRSKMSLTPLIDDDPALHNPYGILVVHPDKHDHVNATLAGALADHLISAPTQAAIAAFRLHGEPLFHPHPRRPPWNSSSKDSAKPSD